MGLNILDQTYNEGEWNEVVIKYINNTVEHSISVNGADFEAYEGVPSEDNEMGGDLDGVRLQGDGDGTFFIWTEYRELRTSLSNETMLALAGLNSMRLKGENMRFRFLTISSNGTKLEKSKTLPELWSLSTLGNRLFHLGGISAALN